MIESERLFLRLCQESDLDSLFRILSDPQVMRFSVTGPLDKRGAQDYLEAILAHYSQYGYGLFLVIEKTTKQTIGLAGLVNQMIEGIDYVELAYRFAQEHWGKGYATEVALAIKRYAFTKLPLNRLISIVSPENQQSKRVAKKVGMSLLQEGSFHGDKVDIYDVSRISLSPYDPRWKELYEDEKQKLKAAFDGISLFFHHIGSTSISGCTAKPIIDILGITQDLLTIDRYDSSLEKLGYIPLGEYGIRQRRFFRKRRGGDVNLHLFDGSNPEAARHLRFCDYLRRHPQKIESYSNLKRELAQKYPDDMTSYLLGKEPMVKEIDSLAAWEDSGGYWNKEITSHRKLSQREEIIDALEANMYLQMTYFAKYQPKMEIVFEPDVTVVRSSIDDDTFNYILAARFGPSNVTSRVDHVLAHFHHLPFSWWVGPRDQPQTLEKELQKQKLQPKEDDLGMYLDLDAANLKVPPSRLSIQRVLTQTALKDFAQVLVSIGGAPQAYELFFSHIPPVLYAEGAPYEIYIGYLEGQPIVTGVLVLHAHVGGLSYIMTDPEYRRRGFGSEMTLFLLKRAKERGYHLATLQASESGRGLYQRLGFEQICRFVEYARVQ